MGKSLTIKVEILLMSVDRPDEISKDLYPRRYCGNPLPWRVYHFAEGVGISIEGRARLAQPGEFTKRAFLNGRIDLTQAEAVIDLIRARTQSSLEIAGQQLRGGLFKEMAGLKAKLIEHLALIEAHIDFPEEEMEPIAFGELKRDMERMIQTVKEWITSYEEGRIFREGISCAIVGKTNVGKSSLLNVLLKEERAIVTPIPGTTRDVIEEVLNIYGIPVRLMDTAGLRKPADSI